MTTTPRDRFASKFEDITARRPYVRPTTVTAEGEAAEIVTTEYGTYRRVTDDGDGRTWQQV